MDQVAIAAKLSNFYACLDLAWQYEVGLEIQTFAFPPVINESDRFPLVNEYRKALEDFPYPLSMHGMFMDMAPGSPDRAFTKITRQRTQESLDVAHALGADHVVFHANFLAMIREDSYRNGWQERMIEFFVPMVEYAKKRDICIVMENMWEFDPQILVPVFEGVNSEHFRSCLDVGHVHLFSKIPFKDWLEELRPWVTYVHMNNNYGDLDFHLGLDDGIMDYQTILPLLREVDPKPRFILEIEDVHDIERSLHLNWLHLPH